MIGPISLTEVIAKAAQILNDRRDDLDSPLPFYAAARVLGATPDEADRLDTLACAAVMRARGAI